MANVVKLSPDYFPLFDRGRPVSNAQLYVGEPNVDPEIEANQKQVYVLQEDGTSLEITQPIRTSGGGVPIYNGSPVTLYVDGIYSLKVLDTNGTQVYYIPRNSFDIPEANTYKLSDFGGDWESAITAIGSDTVILSVDVASTLTKNTIIPNNINLEWYPNATVSGSFDLDINTTINAEKYQLFESEVTVGGTPNINTVYPVWFGNNTTALQKAVNLFPDVTISVGTIQIEDPVIIAYDDQYIHGSGWDCIVEQTDVINNLQHAFFNNSGKDNLVVENIQIKTITDLTVDRVSQGIRVGDHTGDNPTQASFRNLKIRGFNFGVGCYDVDGQVLVEDCDIKINSVAGAVAEPVNINSTQKVVVNRNILDCSNQGDHAVYTIHSLDVVVGFNKIINSDNSSLKLEGTSNVSETTDIEKIQVLYNTFENCAFAMQIKTQTLNYWIKNVEVTGNSLLNSTTTNSNVGDILVEAHKIRNVNIEKNAIQGTNAIPILVQTTTDPTSGIMQLTIAKNTIMAWGASSSGSYSAINVASNDLDADIINASITNNSFDGNGTGRMPLNISGVGDIDIRIESNRSTGTTNSPNYYINGTYKQNSWQSIDFPALMGSTLPGIAPGSATGWIQNTTAGVASFINGVSRTFGAPFDRWDLTGVSTGGSEYRKVALCFDSDFNASIVVGDTASTQFTALIPKVGNNRLVVGIVEIPNNYSGGSLSGFTMYDVRSSYN